jgi:hypothetical protein
MSVEYRRTSAIQSSKENHLQKNVVNRPIFGPPPVWEIPSEISLPAINTTWKLATIQSETKSLILKDPAPKTLLLRGRAAFRDFPSSTGGSAQTGSLYL